MTGRKFFIFIGFAFVVALAIYLLTTPRGSDIPLIGVVDGNEVIVSPQITGRMVKLTVDEGSAVRKGDLIAELDPKELEASLAAATANVASLQSQVREAGHNYSWTDDQTGASLSQARAVLTSTRAQLDQAQATLWRDQTDYERTQKLFDSGVASAQDRDHADATLRASKANVKALEDSVKAQEGRWRLLRPTASNWTCARAQSGRRLRNSSRLARARQKRGRNWATRRFMRRSMELFPFAWRSREKWCNKAHQSSWWWMWITCGSTLTWKNL